MRVSYSQGVSSVRSSSPIACHEASLYFSVTGSGNIDRATGPNPPKRASACRSSAVARPLFLLNRFQSADGGDDVAGLGFLSARDVSAVALAKRDVEGCRRLCTFHGVVSVLDLRPRLPGTFGATRQTRAGLFAHRLHRAAGARRNRRNGRFTLLRNCLL